MEAKDLENRASFLSKEYKPKFAKELKIQYKKKKDEPIYISDREMLIITIVTGVPAAILGYELYCQVVPDIMQYGLSWPF